VGGVKAAHFRSKNMATTKDRFDKLIAKQVVVENLLTVAGTEITAAALDELNTLNGLTASVDELNLTDGSVAGTAVASKALALGATKNIDTLVIADSGLKLGSGSGTAVTKTAATINALVGGVAGGYLIARSAAPVALDGGNPTSVAHGLTTCVAAFAQLTGSVAPGASTSVLTCVINGANVDVYGWKPTAAGDTTMIASTGTESFSWFAIGA